MEPCRNYKVDEIIDRVVFSIYLVYVGSKLVERVLEQMFVIN